MGPRHDAGWMRRRRKVPDVIRRGLRLSIGLAICNSLGFLLAHSVEGDDGVPAQMSHSLDGDLGIMFAQNHSCFVSIERYNSTSKAH